MTAICDTPALMCRAYVYCKINNIIKKKTSLYCIGKTKEKFYCMGELIAGKVEGKEICSCVSNGAQSNFDIEKKVILQSVMGRAMKNKEKFSSLILSFLSILIVLLVTFERCGFS